MPIAKLILITCVVAASSIVVGCSSGSSGSSGMCVAGDLHCACYPNDTCNPSLTCVSKVCVEAPGQDAEAPGTGGTTGSAVDAGGASICTSGNAGCLCLAAGTCYGSLVCFSNICVVPSVVAGAAGGGMASGGVVGSGGIPAAGGTSPIATGGILSTGGLVGGNTVIIPVGGTTTVISGGAITTGGVTPVGGTTTVASGGAITTSGVTTAGGTTTVASGGAITTGGVTSAGGTTTVASGGAISTSGAAGGSTASSAPKEVCPDATHCYLTLDGSSAPASGNSFGINGTFSLVGDSCATMKWNAQTRCASGTLCAKDPPYYDNWGVEIALNLKTGGGYDYPYDATANGVTGFFWTVSGTAPGMQVWIPLTTNPGACLQTTNTCALSQPPWGNPTPSLVDANYVLLKTSTMSYDDWGTAYEYPPPWDPTRLHSITWKLPARASATSYNFCVEKVGVIHN